MRPVIWLSCSLAVWLAACNCGDGVLNDGQDGGSGGSGAGQGAGAGGSGAGQGAGQTGSGASAGGGNCGAVSQQATLGKKPVDIIFVIDNSGSMTEEIIGVQDNINTNFAQIIAQSGLDYRVIMLTRHGEAAGMGTRFQSVCITAPLSGNQSCTPPPTQPANTSNFFHYSVEIGSTNSFSKIITTYRQADEFGLAPQGWQQWLRSNAFKVFIEITDDNTLGTAADFETSLFALTPAQFGSAQNRNYVFHSITGIEAKPTPSDPWLPTELVQTGKCPSGVNAGSNYQNLSIRTGGLRFPVCEPSLFGTVFRKVAEGVVAGAQVACEFEVPTPPVGYSLANKILVNYTPGGGGAVRSFTKVASAAACATDTFYVEANRVILCPTTCNAVKADAMAKIDVVFTCEPDIN